MLGSDAREVARSAYARGGWQEALDAFRIAEAAGRLDPADFDAMADAALACGAPDEALTARQRAHDGFVTGGDAVRAATVAVKLAAMNVRRGELGLVAGWNRKAEELVGDQPESVAHGYLAWIQGTLTVLGPRDLLTADELADRCLAVAGEFADDDLRALGVVLRAEIRAKAGRLEEAGRLFDQVMTTVLASPPSPLVSCHVLCRTLITCQETGDFGRARRWVEAVQAGSGTMRTVPLLGDCRVHHAGVLNWQGSWNEAEREAKQGVAELPTDQFHLSLACYELGEMRLRQGDLAGAEAELGRTHELGFRSPAPAMAELRLAQGRARAAVSLVANALEEETFPSARSLLLASAVELALANEDAPAAVEAAEELAQRAEELEADTSRALSLCANGAVALAQDDARAACASLREGHKLWAQLGVPYRAARARTLLGEAYLAREDPDAAALEFQAALRTFERLGARLDAERVRSATRALAADVAVEPAASRVRRAFMFTDIVNSTPLVAAVGDAAWTELLQWHDRVLRELFRAHFGQEVDHAGDGFFVVFDTAQSAVLCAADIQRKLARQRREHGFAPQVRIGVHVDAATAASGGFHGHGIHVAARIGAQAQGGEVLVSRETLDAAGPQFAAGAPRRVELKGVSQAMELVPVVWV